MKEYPTCNQKTKSGVHFFACVIVSKSNNPFEFQFLHQWNEDKSPSSNHWNVGFHMWQWLQLHGILGLSFSPWGPMISLLDKVMFYGYVLSITIKNLQWKYGSLIWKGHCSSVMRGRWNSMQQLCNWRPFLHEGMMTGGIWLM